MKISKFLIASAGVLGIAGVALGAFGAHALQPDLEAAGAESTWEIAVKYHMIHVVALLGAGIWSRVSDAGPALFWSGASWIGGILLFSGSIYFLALGGPAFLGPLTPVGGLLLLAGWAGVAWEGLTVPARQ